MEQSASWEADICSVSKAIHSITWHPNIHSVVLPIQGTQTQNIYVKLIRFYSNIYIQQDATLHSLFYLETALHVSGGTTTHHQELKQLYLQHLVFVTPLLISAAIVKELEMVWVCCGWRTPVPTLPRQQQVALTVWQIPDAVDTVVCAPDDGWWYHPKHVEQFPDKINCVTLHLVGY